MVFVNSSSHSVYHWANTEPEIKLSWSRPLYVIFTPITMLYTSYLLLYRYILYFQNFKIRAFEYDDWSWVTTHDSKLYYQYIKGRFQFFSGKWSNPKLLWKTKLVFLSDRNWSKLVKPHNFKIHFFWDIWLIDLLDLLENTKYLKI